MAQNLAICKRCAEILYRDTIDIYTNCLEQNWGTSVSFLKGFLQSWNFDMLIQAWQWKAFDKQKIYWKAVNFDFLSQMGQ